MKPRQFPALSAFPAPLPARPSNASPPNRQQHLRHRCRAPIADLAVIHAGSMPGFAPGGSVRPALTQGRSFADNERTVRLSEGPPP